MANPFIDSARTILATLEDDLAAQLAEAARQTTIASGVALTIEEALALALVARNRRDRRPHRGRVERDAGAPRLLRGAGGQAALHRVDLGAASDDS